MNQGSKPRRWSIGPVLLLLATLGPFVGSGPASAQTVEPPYDADYTLVDLGPIADLPLPNGGLTFAPDDPNTIVIGGGANFTSGMLYTVRVVRDAENHISGFAGSAMPFAEAPYNDGGVVYGPQGVLFLSRFPNNEIGQIMPTESTTVKVIDLGTVGVTDSPGGLGFVPQGFPGAGTMKLASWGDGGWYTLEIAPDGSGAYDIVSATVETHIGGGPEGFVYVTAGSPGFADFGSMLVSEWSDGEIAAYSTDGGGNPVPGSRETFVSGLEGAEGAAIDPLTGDFLFSTFSLGTDNVFAVRGFAAPETPSDPECEGGHRSGPGYWKRQCLGFDEDEGGFRPGRRGRGPALRHQRDFASGLMSCAEVWLDGLGFAGLATCDGLDASPANDPCEQAMVRLTAMVLDVCAGRVHTSCEVDSGPDVCAASTVGERMQESAGMIHAGACREAATCLASAD